MDPDPLPEYILGHIIYFSSAGGLAFALITLVLLIIASALVSGSEVAFFSLTSKNLIDIEDQDDKKSDRIIQLLQDPRKLLATILISNNFINIAIVLLSSLILQGLLPDAIFEQWGQRIFNLIGVFSVTSIAGVISWIITVALVTFLLVLFGEITPKIFASVHNVSFAKSMSRPLGILQKVLSPVSAIMVHLTQKIENRVEGDHKSVDRKEIDRAIDLAVNLEDSSEEELDILRGILKFGDITTKQIMKPRVDVISLDLEDDFEKVLKVAKDSGYSRLPVEQEDFDSIVGILYIKDLLGYTSEQKSFEWQQFLRKDILYVPETKKINELLREFQSKRVHMGIVVDEYGGSAGIVTLEDIMEEVLGDIKDEFDQNEEVDYQKIDDRNYIFEGKTLINDMARITDLEIDVFDQVKGDADSLAGLLLELAGYIPKKGEDFEYLDFKFRISEANKRRIEKVQITLPINEDE